MNVYESLHFTDLRKAQEFFLIILLNLMKVITHSLDEGPCDYCRVDMLNGLDKSPRKSLLLTLLDLKKVNEGSHSSFYKT